MNRIRVRAFLLGAMAAAATAGACFGNELKNGGFTSPDNESWDGSSWSTWTAAGVSGRPTWADRLGSGRGAAAFGWNTANDFGIYQDTPGAANVVYTYSIWVRKEINYNEDVTQLNIEWLDSAFNWLGNNIYSNITSQTTLPYSKFIVTGSTTNTNCAIARVVVYTRWKTPTNTSTATIQFDDAELTAIPPTIIRFK